MAAADSKHRQLKYCTATECITSPISSFLTMTISRASGKREGGRKRDYYLGRGLFFLRFSDKYVLVQARLSLLFSVFYTFPYTHVCRLSLIDKKKVSKVCTDLKSSSHV